KSIDAIDNLNKLTNNNNLNNNNNNEIYSINSIFNFNKKYYKSILCYINELINIDITKYPILILKKINNENYNYKINLIFNSLKNNNNEIYNLPKLNLYI